MKNKFFYALLLIFSLSLLSSCAGSRSYGGHKKGYGCPNSSFMMPTAKPFTAAV